MEIILLQDVNGLGEAGDVVNVKPGYARNKLVPEGLALRASKRNLAVAEERKQIVKMRKVGKVLQMKPWLNGCLKQRLL